MSDLNLASVINQWVEQELKLPFKIYNDTLPDADANGACLRYDPAPAFERRFTDGTRLLKWSLSYYVRHQSAQEARQLADTITRKLDGTTIPFKKTELNIEAESLPQFISKDDKGNTLYTASITCTYLEDKGEE